MIPLLVVASIVTTGSAHGQPSDRPALPVIEIPASSEGRALALVLSGDGGWASFVRGLSAELADSGVSVLGVDLRSYLATRSTPEAIAADVGPVLRRYLEAWHRDRIALVGYSRGAVIAPFIVNRLPEDLRQRIDLVAMLGLGEHAGFHVSLLDLLHTTTSPKDPPVLPELEAARRSGVPLLCVYGTEERESLCRDAPAGLMTVLSRNGGHHFDGHPAALADEMLARLPAR